MDVGISTACYYPLETEKSLLSLAKDEIKTTEIFFNAESETRASFVKTLSDIVNEYDLTINSVHTCLTFGESYLVFSDYYRRFLDSLETFKRFFEITSILDSKICVFHGERLPGRIEETDYMERVALISEQAKKQGVIFSQENVVNFRSQSIDFLKRLKNYLDGELNMTFDVKQAVRAGIDPFDFVRELGDDIINIHISDHSDAGDCLPPFDGGFDFGRLFKEMAEKDYCGNYIIELYRGSFTDEEQLVSSYKRTKKLYRNSLSL